MRAINKPPMAFRKPRLEGSAAELLEVLYFVHDKGISAISATMRGQLTQTQASILWLIHSEGDATDGMPRKEVALRLHDWFDLGSPAITSALQSLAQPPLRLVRLVESSDSGREKRVFLTTKGQRFVASMATRGQDLMQELIADLGETLSDDQIFAGIEFLRSAVLFFRRIREKPRLRAENHRNGKKPNGTHAARTKEADNEASVGRLSR
jgi:DNA-binding MarR family transcriptional regulator